MPDPKTVEEVVDEIRAGASGVEALVVPALPGGRGLPKSVVVDLADLLALIRHLRPKLIYLDEIRFEAAVDIAGLVDDEDDDLWEHPLVKKAAKRFGRYEGSLCQVVAIVVHDGIDHAVVYEAAWMEDVKAVAERLSGTLGELASAEAEKQRMVAEKLEKERRDREDRKRSDLIREKANILGADPRFEIIASTKAKRKHLAKTLFPEEANATLTKIVDEAEGAFWLRKTEA